MRGDFFNEQGQARKREMSFPTARQGYKKKKVDNIASQSTKRSKVFKPADTNLIMNLI